MVHEASLPPDVLRERHAEQQQADPEPPRMIHVESRVESVPRPSTALATTPPTGEASQPRQSVRLPAIREASKFVAATDALIEALEREEAAALADFEAFKAQFQSALEAKKARVIEARRALSDMRQVRGFVVPTSAGHAAPKPAALAPRLPSLASADVPTQIAWHPRFPGGCVGERHQGDRTRIRHMARGLCSTCYDHDIREKRTGRR